MASFYKSYKDIPKNNNCYFVAGTNPEGRHGKGSALYGVQNFGGIYGKESGYQGQMYGIVTKDLRKKSHPSVSKEDIIKSIRDLYVEAILDTNKKFYICYDGVNENLNGYSNQEMGDMFQGIGFREFIIPNNIYFLESFAKFLKPQTF